MWAALSSDNFLHSFVYLMCFLSCSPHFSFFVSYISRSRSTLYILPLLSFDFIRSFCVNFGHQYLNSLSLYGLYFFVYFTPFHLFPLSFLCCLFLPLHSDIYISRSISLFFSLPPFISPRAYLIPCYREIQSLTRRETSNNITREFISDYKNEYNIEKFD